MPPASRVAVLTRPLGDRTKHCSIFARQRPARPEAPWRLKSWQASASHPCSRPSGTIRRQPVQRNAVSDDGLRRIIRGNAGRVRPHEEVAIRTAPGHLSSNVPSFRTPPERPARWRARKSLASETLNLLPGIEFRETTCGVHRPKPVEDIRGEMQLDGSRRSRGPRFPSRFGAVGAAIGARE